jgi:hypothetical protein
MNIILEIGGEGGSIHLTESNGKFQYATNEAAALDMLDEEEQLEIKAILEARNAGNFFDTFESAMESLLKRYPIFSLYPLFVHPEYKKRILEYYKKHLQNSAEERN